MPDSIILVDFGASRIKSVLWSLTEQCVIASREYAAPTLRRGLKGEAEGAPEEYWLALEATAGQLLEHTVDVTDLWLCSEMHGFMLASPRKGKPLTQYISWQDQRACFKTGNTPSTLEKLSSLETLLMEESGIRLRPGLPISNLASMQDGRSDLEPVRFLTLVDWLLLRGGETNPRCHPTLAAGTGLYSLKQNDWSPTLMQFAGIEHNSLILPTVQSETSPIGTIYLCGRKIRVWGGLGDLQAAAHGLGFPELSPLLINLGTGSQVLALTPVLDQSIEIRPSARGQMIHAITHIPSGRALNTFADFIDGCAMGGGGEAIFWRLFSRLKSEDVIAADACIDLNVFSASWRFNNGGYIAHILEGTFDLHWLICSLAKSWLTQYAQAINTLGSDSTGSSFLLGGGLSRRCQFIPEVLASLLGMTPRTTPLRTGEETLDGLLRFAETTFPH